MRQANEQMGDDVLSDRIKALPPKQQKAIRTCFKAAGRRSTSGMRYEKEWILECVLLRMRSPKLYEQLRKHKILILPSRTCLQSYVQKFKSGIGFSENVFKAITVKTEDMDMNARHGGIVFDEMKLSEHFSVNAPGDWTQILGVFASRGINKPEMLTKLLLEAILIAERAGLFVGFFTCDGASWNRIMWRSFGIGVLKKKLRAAAKLKKFQELAPWIPAVVNHLYWWALSSRVQPELILAKWRSLVRHVVDIHVHDESLYQRGEHEPLAKKRWLEEGYGNDLLKCAVDLCQNESSYTKAE
ncbi:hypothetical protein HPB49_004179 [Dermacentor silvarum]|uniref:Uncharacterized protein n=1 Tax=Dermacentor silvarum TaxID=543639 RepID=A0ACB8DMW4_DERSI|nr:hypothetical protein HPB49_004179 [Dermacentor silvarum]